MKYGITTSLHYRIPYTKYPPAKLVSDLSPKASMRLKWIDYINKGNSIRKASRHFDIPEASVRYWYRRYDPYNLKSLEDKSKRPFRCRVSPVSIEDAQRVIDLRTDKKKRGWGKVKIQRVLLREGIVIGQSRIQKIMNDAGLKRIPHARRKYYGHKNRKHMYSVPKEILERPGGLVYLDVKHLYLPGGARVYQFTAIDHATRLLRIKLFTRITSRCGKEFFECLDQEFPFNRIRYLGSDNGGEFMGDLDKLLKERNIIHVFSSPRSPKQNPFVERVIRTVIDEEYYYEGTQPTREEQQRELDEYVKVYNEERPHRSLSLRTPMEQFKLLSEKHLNA